MFYLVFYTELAIHIFLYKDGPAASAGDLSTLLAANVPKRDTH